jgi:hypothetical protein
MNPEKIIEITDRLSKAEIFISWFYTGRTQKQTPVRYRYPARLFGYIGTKDLLNHLAMAAFRNEN